MKWGMILFLWLLMIPGSVSGFFSEAALTGTTTVQAQTITLAPLPAPAPVWLSPQGVTAVTRPFPLLTTAPSATAVAAAVTSVTGDEGFCAALTISVANAPVQAVADFATDALSPTGLEQLVLYYDASQYDFAHGAMCDIAVEARAWPRGQTWEEAGFTDSFAVVIRAQASLVVLNEILADPAGTDPEFIELYNNGTEPVDVSGWNITEQTTSGATTSHVIRSVGVAATDLVAYDGSGSTVIPPQGYLALRYVGASPYLNNDGDTVTLLDAAGVVHDQYSYPSALEGKSDARIPDGVGPWIDPIPTPGAANVLDNGGAGLTLELAPESQAGSITPPDIPADSIEAPSVDTEYAVETESEPALLPEEIESVSEAVPTEPTAEPVSEEVVPQVPPPTTEVEEPPEQPAVEMEVDESVDAETDVTELAV